MDYGFAPHKNATRPTADIENDGWFPVLKLAEFADIYGIAAELSDAQLEHCLLLAMDRANQSLATFKAAQVAQGIERLVDVSAGKLGGKSAAVGNYKRAAYSMAKADLLRESISMDRKADAENAANSAVEMVDFYERQATRALANLQGMGAVGVHLI